MFCRCWALKNIDVSNWNTSNVNSIVYDKYGLFDGCYRLEKIDVSDHWQRTRTAFVKEYVYGKSDEEILEITELLSIQRSKEWTDTSGKKHSKNWSDIAKDEDAKAFYESAFKEMAKKLIFSVYAAGKRVAETVAIKVAILHPTDLVLQMTQDLRDVLTNVATISNIVDNLYNTLPPDVQWAQPY